MKNKLLAYGIVCGIVGVIASAMLAGIWGLGWLMAQICLRMQ